MKGWILFDAQCRLCATLARRLEPLLLPYQLSLVPLQTPWVRETLGNREEDLLSEMRLLTADGALYGGADALTAIARQIWWARPLHWIAVLPFVKPSLRRLYAFVARHRYCFGGTCRVEHVPARTSVGLLKWPLTVGLPILAAALAYDLPGWLCMWLMAVALFAAAKWITVYPLLHAKERIHQARLIAYSLAWPGLNARAFCAGGAVSFPAAGEWFAALAKTLFGTVVVFLVCHGMGPVDTLLQGWLGMIAMVFALHFGVFHLLSIFWRALGINAKPLMHSPATSTSLGQFWGERWNTAFSDLMLGHFLRPLARRLGPAHGLFAVFFVSGLLHELVISFPARGGYGLPALYFATQGAGLLFERSKLARRLDLGSGWKGWCFVVLVAGVPAFWLFHPIFIRNVILPMLRTIGGT